MAPADAHLVGRADELGALDHALDELDRGSSVAIELVGEPGIGKTRLLRELARLAETRGYLVLSGSASELERDLPFSVFVDALDEYVHGLEPTALRRPGRRRPNRARARLPVTVHPCERARGGASARAVPQPPCRPAAARAARCDEAPCPRPGRLPLGRCCIGRAARRTAAPATGHGGAHRQWRTVPVRCPNGSQPRSSERTVRLR